MGLSRDEILDLASRYTSPNEVSDFPFEGDLFCLLSRSISQEGQQPASEKDEWSFNGYGVCIGYTIDEEAKPKGKWLWMHFASLAVFPPVTQVLKLQPPHVVKGCFQSADRSSEIRIIKISTGNAPNTLENKLEHPKVEMATQEVPNDKKIIKFRKKKDVTR